MATVGAWVSKSDWKYICSVCLGGKKNKNMTDSRTDGFYSYISLLPIQLNHFAQSSVSRCFYWNAENFFLKQTISSTQWETRKAKLHIVYGYLQERSRYIFQLHLKIVIVWRSSISCYREKSLNCFIQNGCFEKPQSLLTFFWRTLCFYTKLKSNFSKHL